MSTLDVTISADGVTRRFTGEGDGPVLVAAFRSWLAGPDAEFQAAIGSDEIDRLAGVMLASD